MVNGNERAAGGIEVVRLAPELKKQVTGVIAEAFKTEEVANYHLDMDHPATLRRYSCLVDTFCELYLAAGRPVFTAILDGRVVGAGMVRDPRKPIPVRSILSILPPRLPRLAALFSRHPMKAVRVVAAARHPRGLGKPCFTFEVLGVHPEYQDRGVGRRIMEEAQAFVAGDPQISGIFLTTGSTKNQEFYKRRGYLTLKVIDLDAVKVYHMFWQNPAR
jgi:ribosomal protein S18 acetylase RimI-like enzyme